MNITRLCPEIAELKNLTELSLVRNQLKLLPPQIGQLKKLEWLYLSSNNITELPPEIGNLTKLERLFLRNNQLRELPSEVSDLKGVKMLQIDIAITRGLQHLLELTNKKLTKLTVEKEKYSGKRGIDIYIRSRQPGYKSPLRASSI